MISIILNGQQQQISDDPETPLLWVLRDSLKKKGTKFGCGAGLCGACTVHVDGRAVRSCITPIGTVSGANVTTIEGLATEGTLHPLQSAWISEDVPQCGYCQSGQIMQAAAFLDAKAQPTDDEIIAAMSGNVCRCGTYPRIMRAIRRVVDSQ